MTSPRNARQPIVWVMAPVVSGNDAAFPWTWSAWAKEPRLLLRTSGKDKTGAGRATFELVRRTQYPEGGPEFAQQPSTFRAGCYVLITTGETVDETNPLAPTVAPEFDSIDWFGVITDTDFQIADTGDYIGTVEAAEVGEAILDAQRAEGFAQDDGTGYGTAVVNAPSANLNGGDNLVVGNAKLGSDASGAAVFLFARELVDCRQNPVIDPDFFWTRWRLAVHAVTFCRPPGCARMIVRLEDGSGVTGGAYVYTGHADGTLADYLDDPTSPEVFALDGLTLRGILDVIAGGSVGLGWRLELAQDAGDKVWAITIYSRSELNAPYGPPKREPSPDARILSTSYVASDEYTIDIRPSEDDTARYDEVIVEGGRMVFGASLSPLDGNLDRAWTDAEEDAYNAAAGPARDLPTYANVYRYFLLKRVAGSLVRATNPGEADAYLPLLPLVTWTWNEGDGEGTAAITASHAPIYLPSLTFAAQVPWIDGAAPADGATIASLEVKASPSYAKPRVFRFSVDDSSWVDLLSRTVGGNFTPISESPSVDMDERRPGLRIAYSRPHILGLDTFDGTDNGGADPAYDWRKLVVTVGIQSDQRVTVRRRRAINGTPLTNDQVRRKLTVRDDDLNFWCCLAGTLLGVDADNANPVRVVTDTILLNDFAAAQGWCDQLAEWAFRPHESVVIVHNNEEAVRRWKIGMSLYQVVDGSTVRAISGVIASVETDWVSGRVTLRTETPPMPPGRGGGGQSASPSQGGSVSPELGGTLAQALQQQQAKLKQVASDAAKRPLIPAVAGGGDVAAPNIYTIQGNNSIPGTGELGIVKRTDTVLASEMPAGVGGTGIVTMPAYPIPLGLPDGVGVGLRLTTGNEYAFILLDSRSFVNSDVFAGQRVGIGGQVNLDVVVGPVTYRYACLVPNSGPN